LEVLGTAGAKRGGGLGLGGTGVGGFHHLKLGAWGGIYTCLIVYIADLIWSLGV
jgi:hypothetical protein